MGDKKPSDNLQKKRPSYHGRRLSREEKGLLSGERKMKAMFFTRMKKLAHAPDEDTFLKTRHSIIEDVLKHLDKSGEVFDSRTVPGEPISNAALDSTPIFWFKVSFNYKPFYIYIATYVL